jgi:hypothetical protein
MEPYKTVWELLADVPRVERLVKLPSSIYVGPALVQAEGGWTRCGPTWVVEHIGWVCVGPGVHRWNTTQGLAEIATYGCAGTTWHADGVIASPRPHIVLFVTQRALNSGYLERCKELALQVEKASV